MAINVVDKDEQYLLNHCTKYLARANLDERHSPRDIYSGQRRARFADCWRYPIIDAHDGREADAYDWNDVTFVWYSEDHDPITVELLTTCYALYDPIRLTQVSDTAFWAVSLKVPKAQRHRYLFRVDGELKLDPINPQVQTLLSGETWSSFFTWAYPQPVSFERWEYAILDRLTRHILPANASEQRNYLSREGQESSVAHLYRLDLSLGVANFIDKIVAREERHHLQTYKICLELIDIVLRRRTGNTPPEEVEVGEYRRIYDDLANNAGSLFYDGWDYDRYQNPRYFLEVLRRHAPSGAFSHPKYGGNPAGMGWDYLSGLFETDNKETVFAWRQAMEPPLGTSTEYRG